MNLEINQAIELIAPRYSVDPDLIKAIVTQESNYNPYAIRYEPKYQYLYNVFHFCDFLKISQSTETMCQMTSWGLGQIMGAVAREQGHVGPMGQLFDAEVNVKHMCLLIKGIQTAGYKVPGYKVTDILACYNGGRGALLKVIDGIYPNQDYVDSVMKHLNALKGK
jgi:hypothetical protein